MTFMFEKLEVYQKAVCFADQVAALTQDFPRGYSIRTHPGSHRPSAC